MQFESKYIGKTILITGGLGFIGSNMAIKLESLNPKKIILVDSLVPGLGADFENIKELKNKHNVEFHQENIKSIDKMKPLIKEADFIFNLAGSVKHTPFNTKELEFDTEINFVPHLYFLEACRQVMTENPDKSLSIVFAGTRDQYGKVAQEDLPVKEDYTPKALTDYQSVSKNAVEAHHLILNNMLREQGLNIKVNSARVTNTYGPKQSSKAGSAIPVFIEKALTNSTIELWGGGEVLRDCNYVEDVVDAFLLIASSEVHGEVFNLGCCVGKKEMENPVDDNLATIRQIAEKIVKVSGKGQVKVIPYPPERKTVEPGHFAADISKIAYLGWRPKTSLEEGIRKTLEWNSKN